ncbi:MAG TPA: L,D-transpeptidase [Caulobacteraceae bacterium]|nr:L,D-transpeptidase [Caulobacteraceae bacterium]
MNGARKIMISLAFGGLAACQPAPVHKPLPAHQVAAPTPPPAPPVVSAPPPPVISAPAPDPVAPDARIIETATPGPPAEKGHFDPAIVRLEVLLDRAGFSPGVIDGREGTNLQRAEAAYAGVHRLNAPDLPGAILQSLTAADRGPVTEVYVTTAADTAGPFIGPVPTNYEVMARLPALAYSDPEQLLAAKFHMGRKLLEALNPGVNFANPGTRLLVAAVRPSLRAYAAAKVVVDKTLGQVRAYDRQGNLVALYPATVGSTERPAPSGVFAVKAVARNPIYFYDPRRLTFTPSGAKGELRIAPGPNNPVGTTWIALTIPTYGIHGSPEPEAIGKRQSHGCVRLTNWDAAELGGAVKKGVEVDFVGRERAS